MARIPRLLSAGVSILMPLIIDGKSYPIIEDLPVEKRVYKLLNTHGWDYGHLIQAAKENKFDFEYSKEFDDLVKRLYINKFIRKKKEKSKSHFEFMSRLHKEDGESRKAQYDTAKLDYEIWCKLLTNTK